MRNRLFNFTAAFGLAMLCMTSATADMVFVPTGDRDDELKAVATGLQAQVKGMKLALGEKDKLSIGKDERLFIVVHGHENLPWFSSTKARMSWTADEMAKLLEKQGLPKSHKDIYLLVCYGGLSVGDTKSVEKLLQIRNEWANASDSAQKRKKEEEFRSLASRTRPAKYDKTDQVLPLSAQLAQSMKNLGYQSFRIIAYDGPISQGDLKSYCSVVVDLPTGQSRLVEELGKKKWTIQEELDAISGKSKDKILYRSVWH